MKETYIVHVEYGSGWQKEVCGSLLRMMLEAFVKHFSSKHKKNVVVIERREV